MKLIVSHKRFKRSLTRAVAKHIESQYQTTAPQVGERLRELISGAPRKDVQSSTRCQSDLFIEALFFKCVEVWSAYENLLNARAYLRAKAPPNISATTHLRYHIENYLNGVYILQNRLDVLLTYVERKYRLEPWYGSLKDVFPQVRKIVLQPFKGIVELRGAHVHTERFEDYDLHRLSFLEFAADKLDSRFQKIFRSIMKKEIAARAKWIDSNNKSMSVVLDRYFSLLDKLVMEKYGVIRLPSPMKRLTRRCS